MEHITPDTAAISIHALREEGDGPVFIVIGVCNNFYPRPPRGGRRDPIPSTRPRREISIHALREEGDVKRAVWAALMAISIHALREEGDVSLLPELLLMLLISIHALREEGDFRKKAFANDIEMISIHALREEGDANIVEQRIDFFISIHALREEGDTSGVCSCLCR